MKKLIGTTFCTHVEALIGILCRREDERFNRLVSLTMLEALKDALAQENDEASLNVLIALLEELGTGDSARPVEDSTESLGAILQCIMLLHESIEATELDPEMKAVLNTLLAQKYHVIDAKHGALDRYLSRR